MFKYFRSKPQAGMGRELSDSIASLRSELGHERLTDGSRSAILRSIAHNTRNPGPFTSLFTPTRKLVIAGALPLSLTAAIVLSLPQFWFQEPQTTKLTAAKVGGEVVFTVTDGHGVHRVFKSTDPARFGAKALPGKAGRFKDRAEDGIELVFYRAD